MSDGLEPRSSPTNENLAARPALTIFHVFWFAAAISLAALAYVSLREVAFIVRLIATIVAFGLAVVATHLAIAFTVTTWVIPRVVPGSYWEREVNSYMTSVFPGQWGKPPGAA